MSLEIIELVDDKTGAKAKILPGLGFNCYSFTVPKDGEVIETLWASDSFSEGRDRPSGSGIPILFPYPGRIRAAEFSFNGNTYQLPAEDALGNALHGFVFNRPWRVTEKSSRHVVAQFSAGTDDPSILEMWPSDFEVTASYLLVEGQLTLSVLIENQGDTDCPFGLGLHPYFRIPLEPTETAGASDSSRCELKVPVDKVWGLDEGLLPTGKVQELARPGLAEGVPIGDLKFDDVFTGVSFEDRLATTSVTDPVSGRKLVMTFDDGFRECVIYTPEHREAVCIEPYTCVPDAYSLEEQGIDTGLRVLPPGRTFGVRMCIRLE